MTAEEIRGILIDEYGYSAEDVAKLSLSQLNKKLQGNRLLDEADKEDGDMSDVIPLDDDNRPRMFDPNWTEYLINELTGNEIVDGNPTVKGLRRLGHKYLNIMGQSTYVNQYPTKENEWRATVTHTVTVLNGSYDGAADVHFSNTDDRFMVFPVATAETRAEGRAFIRALNLNINSHEELVEEIRYPKIEGGVTDVQIKGITNMCGKKRLDLNVKAVVKRATGKDINFIQELSAEECSLVMDLISSQQVAKKIDEELIGYKEDWKQ